MHPIRRSTSAIAIALVGLFGLAACEPVPGDPGGSVAPPTSIAAPPTTVPEPGPTVPERAGWTYVGGDEFDDGAVDSSLWRQYHNTYGDGNQELACLTPANLTEANGVLTIRSQRETKTCPGGKTRQYTSGFIGSRETGNYFPAFARYEIRAKVPHSQGLWPAFWLRHSRGSGVGEVDVMEYFHSQRPGKTITTLHLDNKKNVSKKETNFEQPNITPGWHVWAVEIDEVPSGVRFDFYLDDALVHSFTDTAHAWLDGVDRDATWDLAINQAVGGVWAGEPDGVLGYLPLVDRCANGGTPPESCRTTGINRVDWADPTSTDYVIDHVRVFTRR